MVEKIFDINNFNVISDDDNYYFIRALNNGDNSDIDNGITFINNIITRVRTDRERYDGESKYLETDSISLEEVFDHIKYNHRTDTNCISLSSNANVSLLYGREYYKDKYVLIKVPKSELGNTTFNAPLYMINEINKRIDNLIANNLLSSEVIEYLSKIDNSNSISELNDIVNIISENKHVLDDSMFEKGIDYQLDNTALVNYDILNEGQNFEKNKIVAKLNVVGTNIIKGIPNKKLIQTIGLALSSLELLHYNEIEQDKIIEIPKEIIDIFALLQQVPKDYPYLSEVKQLLLNNCLNKDFNINSVFTYHDKYLDDKEYTLENMYNLTDGGIDYDLAINIYKKAFYLCKSKLRCDSMITLLDHITGYNSNYQELFQYMRDNCFGVEPDIFSKANSSKLKVSESVSLDLREKEKHIFDIINGLTNNSLKYLIENPENTLDILINELNLEKYSVSKEEYYATAIVDMFDWSKLGISKIYQNQKYEIINKLIDNHVVDVYNILKERNIKESDIANVLLTNIIKNKDISDIDLRDTFSIEELESFLGYYKLKNINIKLEPYQGKALINIDNAFIDKKFTSAIMPTGSGKSFLALSEMLKYKDKNIIYLAPSEEILRQLAEIVKEYVIGSENTTGKNYIQILKMAFPKITVSTYANLKDKNTGDLKDSLNKKYDFIVLDELHRTGANEWNKYLEILLSNQDNNTRVLGITATPLRDVDFNNMADHFAEFFGYTEDEINLGKHMAINLDLEEAIKAGYVVCPRVVNCEYNLFRDLDDADIYASIQSEQNEEKRNELIKKYEYIRKNISKSNGIEKIVNDYVKKDGKYIVFLPITRNDNGQYIDDEGNEVETSKAEGMIMAYQNQMMQYIFSGNYFTNNRLWLEPIYEKIINEETLSEDEINKLNIEKENILMLSRINSTTNNNELLITESNDIAELIIDKMNWEKYNEKTIAKLLRKNTKELMECTSMLGSYSDSKNVKELESFKSNSKKLQLMFVMNKLNEGIHVKKIDGIIWLRPLDSNSKILYLQQLGRCIYGIKPGEEIPEDKRPLILDFVNNSLYVKLDKGDIPESKDLNSIRLVSNYLNGSGLNLLNNNDTLDNYYLNILVRIQSKYSIYLDSNKLNELDYKKKRIISEIINISSDIGLWDCELNIKTLGKSKNKSLGKQRELLEVFGVKPVLKDLYEFKEKIDSLEDNLLEQKKDEYINFMVQNHRRPVQKRQTAKKESIGTFSDGTGMSGWYQKLQKNYNKAKQKNENERSLKENEIIKIYNEIKLKAIELKIDPEIVLSDEEKKDEYINFMVQNHRRPVRKRRTEKKESIGTFSDGSDMAGWYQKLQNNYNKAKQKNENERSLKENEKIKIYNEIKLKAIELKIDLSDEEKKDEYINFMVQNHRRPVQKRQTEKKESIGTFSDGTDMEGWYQKLQNNYNKAKQKNENERSLKENEKIKIYNEIKLKAKELKIDLSDEEKKEEYINFMVQNHRRPARKSQTEKKESIGTFSDGTDMAGWYKELRSTYNKAKQKNENERIKIYEEVFEIYKLFPNGKKSNTIGLKKICDEYGINYNDIKNKSCFDVYMRIWLLEKNNRNVINSDGKLDGIFFMSDDALKDVYGYSKEELENQFLNSRGRGV